MPNKKNNKSRKLRKNKRNSTTRKIKKLNCAPDPERKSNFSCYNSQKLFLIRNAWNERHPDAEITHDDPKKIWNSLKKYMSDTCNNEKCWIEQEFIKKDLNKDILYNTFSPEAPKSWSKNPTEWLDSVNILSVIKQYESKYPCFEFIGPSPIDYDTHYSDGECVWEELCELQLSDLIKKNKNKLGIIFNLDPHYKSGSHWVSLFVNIKKQEIYYFDSNGIKPPKQIYKLMNTITEQGAELGLDFKKLINLKSHQYSNTECGMYSLYFIIQMLMGKNFNTFIQKRIPDSKMIEFRKIYFN